MYGMVATNAETQSQSAFHKIENKFQPQIEWELKLSTLFKAMLCLFAIFER